MEKRQIGKVFPNTTTLAYYSPTSFTITLNTISEAVYASFSKPPFNTPTAEKYSILIHEMRHHLDHISTLWGQKHIAKLHRAVNARLEGNVADFHHINSLKHEEQQFHYEKYYTVHSNMVKWKSKADNWQWQLATGAKFDFNGRPDENNPIVFINFATQTGLHLVRVPLGVAALLETNAINDELYTMHRHIKTLNEDDRLVEAALLSRKMFKDILYNQELALYNSIVHLTANILQIDDLVKALIMSSSIATLCLNVPDDLIANVPINEQAREHWSARCVGLTAKYDRGFLFYNLLTNYKSYFKADKGYNLESLLRSNNLPNVQQLTQLIHGNFDQIHAEVQAKENVRSQFLNLLTEGRRIFHLRGLDGTSNDTFELLENHGYSPHVICSDTDFDLEDYRIGADMALPVDNLNMQQWYSFADTIDQMFDEFYAVRGL